MPRHGGLKALVEGRHADPFGLLGPHADRARGVVRVRAMRPGAASVTLLLRHPRAEEIPMTPAEGGLFETDVPVADPGAGIDYRLRFNFPDGVGIERDDPYRYGRIISDHDLHLWNEGTFLKAHERLGAHVTSVGDATGVHFAVWAPTAQRVSVVGDWNDWDGRIQPMRRLVPSGVWELFVPGLEPGAAYKFEVRTEAGHLLHKTDPFGRRFEVPPKTAAIVCGPSGHAWRDTGWLAARGDTLSWLRRPMAVYEVHLGSWKKPSEDPDSYLTYRELAADLVPYVKAMGFTHIELLPVLEHPYSGSWGYQVTGFFAPTSRHGTPDDFRFFVDACHAAGLGVLLDWVPGHFPKDAFGLARFDGTALYEHEDPRQGEHQDWGTLVFNYGRNEVRNFLLASARLWLDEFHLDGLRVDAVASMLYLDYSRNAGEWVPNRHGGRENLEAIQFLQSLNAMTHGECPGTVTVAEESTSWPAVSRPTYLGGLGFTFKWNMGWMHDSLKYMALDPINRKWHHDQLTFSMVYAHSENFVLAFSHDEVVHGKRALLDKMPGDLWQKCANLRLLYGYMWGHPGKKLLFMGGEFGQFREWSETRSLDWMLLEHAHHRGIQRLVADLNALYAAEPALYERDYDNDGFSWIDCADFEHSVVAFVRRAANPDDFLLFVLNFTPVVRHGYRVGAPRPGTYREVLDTDAAIYGGSGVDNGGQIPSERVPAHGYADSLNLTLPPLGCVVLKRVNGS